MCFKCTVLRYDEGILVACRTFCPPSKSLHQTLIVICRPNVDLFSSLPLCFAVTPQGDALFRIKQRSATRYEAAPSPPGLSLRNNPSPAYSGELPEKSKPFRGCGWRYLEAFLGFKTPTSHKDKAALDFSARFTIRGGCSNQPKKRGRSYVTNGGVGGVNVILLELGTISFQQNVL